MDPAPYTPPPGNRQPVEVGSMQANANLGWYRALYRTKAQPTDTHLIEMVDGRQFRTHVRSFESQHPVLCADVLPKPDPIQPAFSMEATYGLDSETAAALYEDAVFPTSAADHDDVVKLIRSLDFQQPSYASTSTGQQLAANAYRTVAIRPCNEEPAFKKARYQNYVENINLRMVFDLVCAWLLRETKQFNYEVTKSQPTPPMSAYIPWTMMSAYMTPSFFWQCTNDWVSAAHIGAWNYLIKYNFWMQQNENVLEYHSMPFVGTLEHFALYVPKKLIFGVDAQCNEMRLSRDHAKIMKTAYPSSDDESYDPLHDIIDYEEQIENQ